MILSIKEIEQQLKIEQESITPNILFKIKNKNIEVNKEINEISNSYNQTKVFRLKPLKLIMTFTILIIVALSISTVSVYGKEVESITLDINPSIELNCNRFDRVVSINYNNDDAYNIFSNVSLKNKKIEDALVVCYEKLYEKGYLDIENNILIISGCNKNGQYSQDKLNKYASIINNENEKKQINCSVETNVITEELKEESKNNDISFGKMKIISMILELTTDYTFDDLKDLKMNELKDIYFTYKK